MITPIFNKEDTQVYATWHLEGGGAVCLVVPGVGEIRMTPAKAEEIAAQLQRQAEYSRWAADNAAGRSEANA